MEKGGEHLPLFGCLKRKALAVCALNLSGVCFVSAHLNAGQSAVVVALAVMGALSHGAADGFIRYKNN